MRLQELVRAWRFALLVPISNQAMIVHASGGQEQLPSSSDLHTTVLFDDIATVDGLANLTRPYHHFVFHHMYIAAPYDSSIRDRMPSEDLKCAVSLPNAVIGTTLYTPDDPHGRSRPLIATNDTSLALDNLSPYFTLKSLKIKPLESQWPELTLHIWGYQKDGDILKWQVDFPYHFPEMFHVKLEEFTYRKWDDLRSVEIWIAWDDSWNGGSVVEWYFCMDDLKVEFERGVPHG